MHDLHKLSPGDQVWVTDQKVSGTVVGEHFTPRSYQVDVPRGAVHRNHQFLIPMDTTESVCDTRTGSTLTENITETQTPLAPQTFPASPKGSVTRTRSGRAVVKPKRLDL